MNQSRRYLIRMTIFLAFVAVIIIVLFPAIQSAFFANAILNGLIAGVLLIGILYTYRQVLSLAPERRWLREMQRDESLSPPDTEPRLLAPMAAMMAEKRSRAMSTLSMRTLLDGVQGRLEESRDISRYMVGLLVFLGLLGTFWGLLSTIGSISETIQTLSVQSSDFAVMFDELKEGLREPLSGMGTAFSSSLFGLAGSLVLGFLDLQSGQAQNEFVNELEEWLSGQSRVSAAGAGIEGGDQSVPAYIGALLEQTADSLDSLERTITRLEENRRAADDAIADLSGTLARLTDQLKSNQQSMLQRLGEAAGLDEASRDHLRNVDVHLSRIAQELDDGRDKMIDEIRSEIRLLSRTIANIGDKD